MRIDWHDINWRNIDELFDWDDISSGRMNVPILVYSNNTVFVSESLHIEYTGGRYEDCSLNQKVTHFAFLNYPEI